MPRGGWSSRGSQRSLERSSSGSLVYSSWRYPKNSSSLTTFSYLTNTASWYMSEAAPFYILIHSLSYLFYARVATRWGLGLLRLGLGGVKAEPSPP